DTLQSFIKTHSEGIEAWFDAQYRQVKPLFYSSVDLRHSGNKLAPVDTNLFPAGFNNLSEDAKERAVHEIHAWFDMDYPDCHTILLVPEGHTRNGHYLDNVVTLKELLERAGKEVVLGNADITIHTAYELTSASG